MLPSSRQVSSPRVMCDIGATAPPSRSDDQGLAGSERSRSNERTPFFPWRASGSNHNFDREVMRRMDDRLEQRRQHREHLLDEALKETFPASDPPSIARPEIRITEQTPLSTREETNRDV